MFDFTQEQMADIAAKIKKIASPNRAEAEVAAKEFAQAAIETPIRKTLLSGDIISGIFTPEDFTTNPNVMYPLDLLTPGQEKEYYAFTIPNHGHLPQRKVSSDYLMVPTYRIGNVIDADLRYIEDANWPVISRMIEVMEAGVVKKMNDDGWSVLISAGIDRNILTIDPNASAGQFTPRLVSLMKNFMRRNGGGNSTTLGRAKLTDLYVSPEALDDIRAWNLDQVADSVRANIYYSADDGNETMRVYNVDLHDLDELGEGQEYQQYFASNGGTMGAGDTEIVVGLDLQRQDSFVMPRRKDFQVWEDNTAHRRGEFSLYGWGVYGMACLDSRRVLLGSF